MDNFQGQLTLSVTEGTRYYQIIFDTLGKNLKNILKSLAGYAAGFIQQLGYWLNNENVGIYDDLGNKWIYNAYWEWQKKYPYLSIGQIGRIARTLEKLGIIRSTRSSDLKKAGCAELGPHFSTYDRTKYYTINQDVLDKYMNTDLESKDAQTTQNPNLHIRTIDHSVVNDRSSTSERCSIYKEIPLDDPNNTVVEDKNKNIKPSSPNELNLNQAIANIESDSKDQNSPPVVLEATNEIQIGDVLQNMTQAIQTGATVDAQPTNEPPPTYSPPPENCPKATKQQNELLDLAEDLGVKLNPQLTKFLLETTIEDLKRGLKVLREQRRNGQVKSPAGLLRKAISEKWIPSEDEKSNNPSDPHPNHGKVIFTQEFLEWYHSTPKSPQGLLDIPISQLSSGYCGEPLVYLAPPLGKPLGNAPYEVIKWTLAKQIIDQGG